LPDLSSKILRGDISSAIRRVLTSRCRLGFLSAGGLGDALALRRFLADVVPLAYRALRNLEHLAERIPDEGLREQALSSIRSKSYHVAGACILATFLPAAARSHYVEIVAPLESIYDFLDSLCDRHPDTPVQAFRQLHLALRDALDPSQPMENYYRYGPAGSDGDYLSTLVRSTRSALGRLDGHAALAPVFSRAVALYADTQTFKHLSPSQREPALKTWHRERAGASAGLTWYEFGAAAGSQFHVYAPLFAAFRRRFDEIESAYDAYFPAFCALHVLLDSFIDADEDRRHAELNWAACYPDAEAFRARSCEFARQASQAVSALSGPHAHRFALRIMALFYLTHPKVYEQGLEQDAETMLRDLQTSMRARPPRALRVEFPPG
jgi:tetraprenyl-beta-curcumene synthase